MANPPPMEVNGSDGHHDLVGCHHRLVLNVATPSQSQPVSKCQFQPYGHACRHSHIHTHEHADSYPDIDCHADQTSHANSCTSIHCQLGHQLAHRPRRRLRVARHPAGRARGEPARDQCRRLVVLDERLPLDPVRGHRQHSGRPAGPAAPRPPLPTPFSGPPLTRSPHSWALWDQARPWCLTAGPWGPIRTGSGTTWTPGEWIWGDLVQDAYANLPERSPPTLTPQSSVNSSANLRGGPGTEFPVVGGLPAGSPVEVKSRTESGDWLQLASGAWIAAFLIDDAPPRLPIATNIPALPIPTFTPVPH